jgi:hypothetical protein
MSLSIDERLTQDHVELDRRLAEIAEAVRPGGCRAEVLAPFENGLRAHMAWEEDALFPALLRAAGDVQRKHVESLRIDHERIRMTIDALREALGAPDPAGAEGLLETLRVYLDGHNHDEEYGAYVEADRRLPPEEREKLLALFERRGAP